MKLKAELRGADTWH